MNSTNTCNLSCLHFPQVFDFHSELESGRRQLVYPETYKRGGPADRAWLKVTSQEHSDANKEWTRGVFHEYIQRYDHQAEEHASSVAESSNQGDDICAGSSSNESC